MNETPTVPEQIVGLLRAEGPLTLSAIALKLGRNPGSVRQRLFQMARTGRLVAAVGPNERTVYSVPDENKEEGS